MADGLASLRRRVHALQTPPILVVDTAIAVLCYLATVAVPVKTADAVGWPLFVLAGVASMPLVWRRRHPVAVVALVGAGTVGLAVTGVLDGVPLPYGQLAATYTVASLASPLWRLVVVLCTGVGVVVSVVVLLGQGPSMLGAAALPFVAAYALGIGVRARRDRIAMLEERAQRLVDEQRATAARERALIARELHDIVAHSVSIIVVQAEAGLVVRNDPAKAGAAFDAISATGRDAMTQLGRALGVLRDGAATRHPQPGLQDVPTLVEQARRSGLDVELRESGRTQPVPADLGTAAYRLVQEAVTNTIRHAEAGHVLVHLDWHDTGLHIEVTDDGRGPATAGDGSGHGLVGMRERVHAFGGHLRTGAGERGAGFWVHAVLPFDVPISQERADG